MVIKICSAVSETLTSMLIRTSRERIRDIDINEQLVSCLSNATSIEPSNRHHHPSDNTVVGDKVPLLHASPFDTECSDISLTLIFMGLLQLFRPTNQPPFLDPRSKSSSSNEL